MIWQRKRIHEERQIIVPAVLLPELTQTDIAITISGFGSRPQTTFFVVHKAGRYIGDFAISVTAKQVIVQDVSWLKRASVIKLQNELVTHWARVAASTQRELVFVI